MRAFRLIGLRGLRSSREGVEDRPPGVLESSWFRQERDDERSTTVADTYSMTVSELAGKLLTEEHADLLRQAVRTILAELSPECVSASPTPTRA